MNRSRPRYVLRVAQFVVAALITTASFTATSYTANAAPAEAAVPGPPSPSAAFAAENEIAASQAERILAGQESFSLLLATLETKVATFAGGAIDPAEDLDAVILFTEEPGAIVRKMIAEVPLRISVVTSAGVSASELRGVLERSHVALEASASVVGATGYADFATGSVHFDVWLEPGAELSEVQRSARSLASGSVSIEIRQASGQMPVDEFNGGQHLSNACTSAFTVRKSGQGGVLSAAHCTNSVSGYTFGGQVESGSTDAQWHKATGPSNRIRYTSGGATQAITTYYAPAIGASACNYGAATGCKCSTIWTNSACWPGLGCGFYAVSGGVTSGGDSGGPWFSGSAAFGVHKGSAPLGFANRSVFTYVGNALSSLGLTLCTTSTCNLA